MQNYILPNAVNQSTYSRADVIEYYQKLEPLFETEKVLFEKLLPTIKDSKILELGVGGGRATKHLLQISTDYVGLDYVAKFAEEAGKKFPNAKILCGDARNLSDFADQTFDFALFAFNGIDYVSNEDRLKILSEIYRVLKKDGIFMFSSHNRDYEYFKKLPWHHHIQLNSGYFKFVVHCLRHLPNHFRMKRHEIFAEDYAVVNDGDHRFSLLTYYIGIGKQTKQLTEIGFKEIEAYDSKGKLTKNDVVSPWIYYLARKI